MRLRVPLLALLLAAVSCKDKDVPDESAVPDDSTADDTGLGDADGDGSPAGEDCDDTNSAVFPGATEVCDEQDNDCDGQTDEDVQQSFYSDGDADGYGAGEPVAACTQPEGTSAADGDCDDADPAYHPGADESDCADPNDYNCDGSVGYDDNDNDGFAACEECNDGSAAAYPGAEEVCDDLDNNCDGQTDEGVSATWYIDADQDGYGDPDFSTTECEEPAGYAANADDCDDSRAEVNPAAVETCNGLDDDCDALTDDQDDSVSGQGTWYTDQDQDGYGDTAVTACAQPSGSAAAGGDCDDTETDIYPGANEVCDGEDNDCDGLTDDQDDSVDLSTAGDWYADSDQDGTGDPNASTSSCAQPSGFVLDSSDCDDSDSAVNTSATELCDGVDNNCDGTIDEDSAADASTWYLDADNDVYGDPNNTLQACSRPSGYRGNSRDCDDSDAAINPVATEVCDSLDNDCDSAIDDADGDLDLTSATDWYADGDQDGYGDPGASTAACLQPSGAVADSADCDDTNANISPAAAEFCDGADNNCDGSIDEGSTTPSVSTGTTAPSGSCAGSSNQYGTISVCGCSDVTIAGAFQDYSDGSAGQSVGATVSSTGFTIAWDDCSSGCDCDLDISHTVSWSASKSGTTLTVTVTNTITGYDAGNSLGAGYTITGNGTSLLSSGSNTTVYTYTCSY